MDEKLKQLEVMMDTCRRLGTVVDYRPEYRHFTAMVWEDLIPPCGEEKALLIQAQIKEQVAQYPQLVCYCFDPYSTLVYTI